MEGVEAVDITAAAPQLEPSIPVGPLTKVGRNTNLGQLAAASPAAAAVLTDWGLHCVGCFASSYDSVEAGARLHGMSDKEIDQMIKEVNNVIQGNTND